VTYITSLGLITNQRFRIAGVTLGELFMMLPRVLSPPVTENCPLSTILEALPNILNAP